MNLLVATIALVACVAAPSTPITAVARTPPAMAAEPRSAAADPTDAPGVSTQEQERPTQAPREESASPATGRAETVITATRFARPLRDVPSTVIVLPREEIDRSPALTVDALVRTVASAATFRRNTSLVADPTAQGLNLRGVGPSGISRALVLLDGVPVSEPFGSWIFWRSISRLGIERIEVAPGAGSALYGSSAIGGVVQLVSRELEARTIEADLTGGSFGTAELVARATHRLGWAAFGLEGELLRTDGFQIVGAQDAGAVDGPASGSHGAGAARVEADPWTGGRADARFSWFGQEQNGGTRFTTSSVRLYGASARLRQHLGVGRLEAWAFARAGTFRQTRARIDSAREEESLSARQTVPVRDAGAAAVWMAPAIEAAGRHVPSFGIDLRSGSGRSLEILYPAALAPTAIVERNAGGAQRFLGAFAQDQLALSGRLELVGAIRYDVWQNFSADRSITRQDGAVEETRFADRWEQQLSPRVAALYRPLDWLALRASAGRAFRAPTLNELYRPFQVGTVLTLANEALTAERLWGAETGIEVSPSPLLVARVTGFWNRLENAVSNATLPVPIDGAQRQRQNLGVATILGAETSLEARLARSWILLLAHTWVDARVTEAPGNPALIGKRLAQDPEHRGVASVTFDDPRVLTATAQVRAIGPQYEDDLNQLPMGGYPVVDASISRRLVWGIEAFAAVENLLNRRYLVGRAGIDTYGQPFTLRGGIRLRSWK
jgi:outer membrane receptor protein involved in Fe transport